MAMSSIYEEIKKIKEELEQKINHPYILKFVKLPVLDDDKILLLYSILKKSSLPKKKLHNYIITTMLVQIALDTHENVSNSTAKDNDDDLKERQLTVLAGSYYSGIYYYLLSNIDDVEMIQTLATAIKMVNEEKITVYQKEALSINDLVHHIGLIESILIQKVADYVNSPELKKLALDVLLLKRLTREKDNFLKFGLSDFFEALRSEVVSKAGTVVDNQIDQLVILTDQYINQTKSNIIKYINDGTPINALLKERVENLVGSHGFYQEKVAEEG